MHRPDRKDEKILNAKVLKCHARTARLKTKCKDFLLNKRQIIYNYITKNRETANPAHLSGPVTT